VSRKRKEAAGGDPPTATPDAGDGRLAPARESPSMGTIAITGASGFVGGHLRAALARDGHEIRPLSVRSGVARMPWTAPTP
jgi:hypothetical protein